MNRSRLRHVIVLNTLDACWIAVDVWSNSNRCRIVSVLFTDVMPIYMIMPRYSHNYALFYQLLNSNFSPTVEYAILREATSEAYGPRFYSPLNYFPVNLPISVVVYFTIFTFQSIQQKYQKYLYYYLYQISLS